MMTLLAGSTGGVACSQAWWTVHVSRIQQSHQPSPRKVIEPVLLTLDRIIVLESLLYLQFFVIFIIHLCCFCTFD